MGRRILGIVRRMLVVALTVGALAVSGCAATETTAGTIVAPDRTALAALSDDRVEHVVAISVDGLAPRVIRRLGPDRLPTYHRLRARGASTMNARSVRASTSTLPNHVSMVTGRRVGTTAGHQVRSNRDTGRTVHAAAARYVASVFDVVHDRGGRTALYVGKPKLDLLGRSWNARNGARDRVGADNGRAKIDRFVRTSDQRRLVRRVVADLRSDPAAFTFVHLAGPDRTGHRRGFGSAAYADAVRATDRQIGRILQAITRDADLRGRTTVVVTSDHGGAGRGHADASRRANYTVPFFVWGEAAARGANLYRLNPDRAAPGAARTTHRGRQPVRNADLANLATDLLDLPRVPGSIINIPRTLDVS